MSGAFLVLLVGTGAGLTLTVLLATLLPVREVDATLDRVRQVPGAALRKARASSLRPLPLVASKR